MTYTQMNLLNSGYENDRLRKAKDDLRNHAIALIDKALTKGIANEELPDISLFKILYDRQQKLDEFVFLNSPHAPEVIDLNQSPEVVELNQTLKKDPILRSAIDVVSNLTLEDMAASHVPSPISLKIREAMNLFALVSTEKDTTDAHRPNFLRRVWNWFTT